MEDITKRNGVTGDSLSKKDKRRQQISSRLGKLNFTFNHERDNFYRASLHHLQTTLATLQQGTNEEFCDRKLELEESRDYELTKLRLWEEYQVKRIDHEYNEDITKAKENHDRMIKLIKEKLYDKLQKQIKQLKEDKLLLNLVNANSWNAVNANDSSTVALNAVAAASSLNINDRRSLRKREMSSRFTAGEADDLSDGAGAGASHSGFGFGGASGHHFSSGNNGYNALANGSGPSLTVPRGNGYISSSGTKRRRHYATRYSSNDELSSGITSTGGGGGGAASGGGGTGSGNSGASSASGFKHSHHGHSGGASSGNDSNLSDKDYDALNSIIMGNEDGGMSLMLMDHHSGSGSHQGAAGAGAGGSGAGGSSAKSSSSGRPNTRNSHKQFVGVQGLKPEELNDDLTLLRNAIKKEK